MLVKYNNKTVETLGDAGGLAFNRRELLLNEYKRMPYPMPTKCLTFSANTTQTIALSNTGGNQPVIMYSFDKSNWHVWNYSPITFPSTKKIYFAGYNQSGFSTRDKWSTFVLGNNTATVVDGDVMSLISGNNRVLTIPNEGCFKRLFYNCTPLYVIHTTDEQTPFGGIMSADVLKPFCYEEMFAGCTRIFGMSIGASKLANMCCYRMFSGCSSLHFIEMLTPYEGYGYDSFKNWLTGVKSSGTLWYRRGTSYIWEGEQRNGNVPSRWTLELDPNAS